MNYFFRWQRCGGYAASVLSDGPLGYWRLGELSGATAYDAAGVYDGTYENGVSLGADGISNTGPDTATTFDGQDDRVSISDAPALRLDGDFTIEFWARMDSFGNSWPGLIRKGASHGTNSGYLIYYSSSLRPTFKRAGQDGFDISSSGALSGDRYRHYAVSYDSSANSLRWYADGNLDRMYSGVEFPAGGTAPLWIGHGDQSGAHTVDEVAIYPTALAGSRISAHHSAQDACLNSGFGRTYEVSAGDVGYHLRVIVEAENASGADEAVSDRTAMVRGTREYPPPVDLQPPMLFGSPRAGSTLSTDMGIWEAGTPSFVRWQRCGPEGGSCVVIPGADATRYSLDGDDVGYTFRVEVTAEGVGGEATAMSEPTAIVSTSVEAHPRVATAGDIACDPDSSSFNAGAGTATVCRQHHTADLLDSSLAGVLTLGDIQYECGNLEDFLGSYDPSWGRFKSITYPAPGNHEYYTTCSDAQQAGAGYFEYFGTRAGDPSKGYYSFDLGGWHMIALNSECAFVTGGCGPESPQVQWLQQDLSANQKRCTLAFWHRPRWSSAKYGSDPASAAFWDALYAAGADVVLAGHSHAYERFLPQSPDQRVVAGGLRQFVVGTGGRSLYAFDGTYQPNSVARSDSTFGILELALQETGYEWNFRGEEGSAFGDSGSALCN